MLSIGAGAGFLRNALANEPELEETVQRTVCDGAGKTCNARMTSFERSSFGRTWKFDIGGEGVSIHCERPYVVLGDYACKRSSSLSTLSTLSTSPLPSIPPVSSTRAVSAEPKRALNPAPKTSAR